MLGTGLPGSALLVLMGSVVGRQRDLGEQVKWERTERKPAEEELGRSQEAVASGQPMALALSQAAQAVQRARTPDEVYRTVGDEMAGLGCQAMVFSLADGHLVISHMTFEGTPLRAAEKLIGLPVQEYRVPLAPGGFFERVIAEGETAFTERTAEHMAETLSQPLRPLAGRLAALLSLEQSIVAPLRTDGETHGLLVVTGSGLSETDVPAVTAFANQTAIALQNARLFEAAQRELAQRKRAEEALRQRTLELGERVKELNCLYGISSLAGTQGISLEEILQGVVDLIPPAWQHPEIACARIIGGVKSSERRTSEKLSGGRPATSSCMASIWALRRSVIWKKGHKARRGLF